jgi:hypothetical protein
VTIENSSAAAMNLWRRAVKGKYLWRLLVLFFLVVALPPIRAEEEFQIVTEKGVPVAVNPAHPLLAPDSPRDIRFEEELTLGAAEGDPSHIFGDFIRFAADDEMLRGFLEQYHSSAYLQQHPLGERLAHHNRLRDIFGKLISIRVTLSLDFQTTLLVRPAKKENVLVMRFQLEEQPSHKLSTMTFSGIDRADVPDEYVDYVATRAAPVSAELRESTVKAVARVLKDVYIYPELGESMSDTLLRHQAQGTYAELTKAGALADKLTEDAVALSGDLHIWVEAQNPLVQVSSDPVNRDPSELRRDKFDFKEARMVSGNVGIIKFDMIHDEEEAQEIMAAALADVSGCKALVLDLRDNIGGEWGTAALLLGYVLPGGTIYSRTFDREGALIKENAVPSAIPGRPFDASVPIYVLTSKKTGSAAEALAYTLKHMGRATIVGEVTRGMAHPSKEVVVNDYFRMSIPYLGSENVNTGTDWEGVGVVPDISVPAEDAMQMAVREALQRIGKEL